MRNNEKRLPAMLPALLLIPIVALFRIAMAWQTTAAVHGPWSWLPGFSPLSAVAFCAGAFLPRRLALIAPLGILFLSDLVIDAHYGASFWTASMAARYLILALIACAGLALRERSGGQMSVGATLGGTLLASAGFYAVTNSFTWLGSPEYPQTAAGWIQALTVGLPGYLPSLYFFRNSLVSDMLYSILLLVCVRLPQRRVAPAKDASRHPLAGTSF
jgi:hypothetical protein